MGFSIMNSNESCSLLVFLPIGYFFFSCFLSSKVRFPTISYDIFPPFFTNSRNVTQQRFTSSIDVNPTEFTQLITVLSNADCNLVWSTSCWYCPTPIDFGSILNSANGSESLLPIETEPRTVYIVIWKFFSRNFTRRINDAPASRNYKNLNGFIKSNFLMKNSVSREAVPFR